MRDLDQQRAAFAWARVEQARNELGDGYGDYKNLAKAAPALIMNNGLMQTLAFFWSKGNEHDPKKLERNGLDHHDLLRRDILEWLGRQFGMPRDYMQMMNAMFRADSEQYRLATGETMHLLRWLRQFADSSAGG